MVRSRQSEFRTHTHRSSRQTDDLLNGLEMIPNPKASEGSKLSATGWELSQTKTKPRGHGISKKEGGMC